MQVAKLLIVGKGEEFDSLSWLVKKYQLHERVEFLGVLTHQHLVDFYNIADALILASSREGMVNILLESMACGAPVVCNKCRRNPEVVKQPEAGF